MSRPVALRGNVETLLTRYPSLAVQEMESEPAWWWLSFFGEGKFLGIVIVFAHGILEAVKICKENSINPGGEVVAQPVPAELVPPEKYRNRILTEQEAMECMPGAEKTMVKNDDVVESGRPMIGEKSNQKEVKGSDVNTPDSQGTAKKFIIATLPNYNKKTRAGYSGRTGVKLAIPVVGDEHLPPSPQLLCSKCDFRDDNPEHLAEHLIQAHGYTTPVAWFEAGQENERLYPRLAAPAGQFTVLGVDTERSRGSIIANCSSLEDAIAEADGNAELFPEVCVQDDSGREVYKGCVL